MTVSDGVSPSHKGGGGGAGSAPSKSATGNLGALQSFLADDDDDEDIVVTRRIKGQLITHPLFLVVDPPLD